MAGLVPYSLRLDQPETEGPTEGITVDFAPEEPTQEIAEDGTVLRIYDPSGAVTVSVDGKGLGNVNGPEEAAKWYANLADKIDDQELGRIANDLIRGVQDDELSRKAWVDARKQGIQLLGLKVEIPGVVGASDGAPVEGMSRVRHPLLLEAVLRFQANARSELLPTDGPVKIRNDDNNADPAEDRIADALEKDLNHYLTSTATEYYPDTDRMLLMLGFGGTAFKKVYFCPLRNRPVSETIDAEDLIVTANATDLMNARRVTHKVMMSPSVVKRMQIIGAYRDIDLSTPSAPNLNEAERAKAEQAGVNVDVTNPEDRNRELYECYADLDIKGFEHKIKGHATGLELPYRVTIDVTSQQILSVVRNYSRPKGDELPQKRTTFVQYVFIQGLGEAPFYGIGLLHILGNTTNAMTAAWREMLDNGMFANFPGFLVAKQGTRQNTNIVRVPAGGAAQIDTQGMAIKDAVMPLPYETAHMPALMDLVSGMAEAGARIGGTAEIAVGEGRQDAPVGTTLALIDMATKMLNAVHKRMHQAQAQEFALLCDCFREHPASFWQKKGKSAYPWDEATFLKALDDYDLVPQADPNTASHTQRVMKVFALKQLQAASPDLYDPKAIDTVALQTLGFSNPEQFFAKPGSEQQKPEIIKGLADIQNEGKKADAALISAKANEAKVQADIQAGLGAAQRQEDTPVDVMDAQTRKEKLGLDAQRLRFDQQKFAGEMAADREEREADHHLEILRIANDVLQQGAQDPGREAKRIDEATE
jgi:hypothetical protein